MTPNKTARWLTVKQSIYQTYNHYRALRTRIMRILELSDNGDGDISDQILSEIVVALQREDNLELKKLITRLEEEHYTRTYRQ